MYQHEVAPSVENIDVSRALYRVSPLYAVELVTLSYSSGAMISPILKSVALYSIRSDGPKENTCYVLKAMLDSSR